jgi:hypothetical protein
MWFDFDLAMFIRIHVFFQFCEPNIQLYKIPMFLNPLFCIHVFSYCCVFGIL